MQFDSLQDFLAMGGYALYVWLSFGVSLLALVWVVIDSAGTHKKLLRNAREEQARQARPLIVLAKLLRPKMRL